MGRWWIVEEREVYKPKGPKAIRVWECSAKKGIRKFELDPRNAYSVVGVSGLKQTRAGLITHTKGFSEDAAALSKVCEFKVAV